ncbi:MAG TPA: hypothetical protein VH134_04950 [Candidatus Dormibacteraeota bacterium]|nr:hypothetical protein [Candidatus Dormibacteraeota bacterium]
MRVNRTQAAVLAFFVLAWLTLVSILVAAPETVNGALRLSPGGGGRAAGLVVTAGLTAFIALLGVGVVRRWRWMFWLVLAAFLAGLLRVPASALQLAGILPSNGPTWYALLQGAIGILQFVIGLAMLAGLRRGGPWGPF